MVGRKGKQSKAFGRTALVWYLFNAESLWSIAAHEFCESSDGDSASASDELQQTRAPLVIAFLHQLPEPLDLNETGRKVS